MKAWCALEQQLGMFAKLVSGISCLGQVLFSEFAQAGLTVRGHENIDH